MENSAKVLKRNRFDKTILHAFFPVFVFSATCFAFALLPSSFAQEPTASDIGATPTAKIAQNEELRRTQAVFLANQALDAGDVFLQEGDNVKAGERYQYALTVFQSVNAARPLAQRARAGLIQVKINQAEIAAKNGDFPQAFALVGEIPGIDPSAQVTADAEQKKIAGMENEFQKQRVNPESTTNNPVLTSEFKDKVATVQRLFFEGDRFFETGQYDRAESRYRQILAIDPYNKAARQKLDRLDRTKERAAEVAHDTSRTKAIYDIERRWTQEETPTVQASTTAVSPAQESGVAQLTAKLASIRIDSISFVNQPVDEAIRILSGKAKQADPSGEGINFVLKLTPTELSPAKGAAAAPAPTGPPPVTLSLTNQPLSEVLRVLMTLTNLKYKIDEHAIFILPATENSDVLITRTFVVPTGFFQGGLSTPKAINTRGGDSGVATTVDSVKIDVKQQLTDQGVDFPTGATAAFLAGSSRLVVKNSPDQIDRIDALLQAASQEEDPQIEIETKFAEFTDNALRSLQINWGLSPNGNPASAPLAPNGSIYNQTNFTSSTGVGSPTVQGQTSLRGAADIPQDSIDALLQNSLNGTTTQNSVGTFFIGGAIGSTAMGVLVQLIDQLKGVDLLSAPKVTTKNRTAAKIEISEQMTFPNQFSTPTYNTTLVEFNNNETTLIAPPTPSSFDKQSIGVTLDVTPVAYADRRIDLELKPVVTDFDGFVDYGSTVNVGNVTNTDITAVETYHVRLPVFNNRDITTKLQVIDGQTVVMGGLVREDTEVINDKVPVLGDLPVIGRLFQSKVDQRTKRNLLIFITARIIRSTGKAKFAEVEVSPSAMLADSATPPPVLAPAVPPPSLPTQTPATPTHATP